MKMLRHYLSWLAAAALAAASSRAEVNIVATLPDLASLAGAIGGGHIKITTLAGPAEDPHFIDPKPSFIRVLNRADLLIEGGAGLEAGWLPPLLQNARNRRILGNSPGHLIAARGITLLDVPAKLDRSEGDVHPLGNPHYLLDPANARAAARTIADTLSEIDPANRDAYRRRFETFSAQLQEKEAVWEKKMKPFANTPVVTYHKTYSYFLKRFSLLEIATIEPKPGVEPSPSHITELIGLARQKQAAMIFIEPFRSKKTAEQISRAIHAPVVPLPIMPSGQSYLEWIDHLVEQIETHGRNAKAHP